MIKDNLPDFLILGIMRAGTTSLFRYMRAHPLILGPIKNGRAGGKEINFFNRLWTLGLDWYKDSFPPRTQDMLFGEATPDYLCDPNVTERILEVIPDAKFICLLRNPVDRAWSHYCHYRDFEFKKMNVNDFLEMRKRVKDEMAPSTSDNSFYNRDRVYQMGFYCVHLERWFNLFPKEQLLIIQSEQFYNDPKFYTNQCFAFLGLEDYNLDTYDNIDMLRRIRPKVKYPPIPAKVREVLSEFYKPYNLRLYKMLKRTFNW